ncbi:response regulator, partial [Clostridium perfringens]
MSNILIIEDEESVANVIKAYLEKDKYNVKVCNSGIKALEVFKEIDFQLVILDLMLPDIDGEE